MTDKATAFGNQVYVVSWDGAETYKIHLDHDVNRIAVTPDDKTLYGVNSNMDIIQFTLKEI